MSKQIMALIVSVGMLVFVTIAPFNPLIFFSIGAVAMGIGFWAVCTLIRIKRENLAVKSASPTKNN